jgi:hypothetical protein
MPDLAARDADRWWAALPAARRVQLHRMMDRDAREPVLPEHQLVLADVDEHGTVTV